MIVICIRTIARGKCCVCDCVVVVVVVLKDARSQIQLFVRHPEKLLIILVDGVVIQKRRPSTSILP